MQNTTSKDLTPLPPSGYSPKGGEPCSRVRTGFSPSGGVRVAGGGYPKIPECSAFVPPSPCGFPPPRGRTLTPLPLRGTPPRGRTCAWPKGVGQISHWIPKGVRHGQHQTTIPGIPCAMYLIHRNIGPEDRIYRPAFDVTRHNKQIHFTVSEKCITTLSHRLAKLCLCIQSYNLAKERPNRTARRVNRRCSGRCYCSCSYSSKRNSSSSC